MIFTHLPNHDKKKLNLTTYNVSLSDVELKELYDRLFEQFKNVTSVLSHVHEPMLTSYIKAVVVDEFIHRYKPKKGDITKLMIITNKARGIEALVSHHEQLDKIIY